MLPDDFTALANEFNETARKFPDADTVTHRILLAKYSALLQYKAETDADRIGLAHALFDCGIRVLKKAAKGPSWGDSYTPGDIDYPGEALENARAIFSRLAEPDSLGALPADASVALADAALAILRKAETMPHSQFTRGNSLTYGDALTGLAETALDYAAKLKLDRAPPDISTSQNIALSKRITLKKEGPEA